MLAFSLKSPKNKLPKRQNCIKGQNTQPQSSSLLAKVYRCSEGLSFLKIDSRVMKYICLLPFAPFFSFSLVFAATGCSTVSCNAKN